MHSVSIVVPSSAAVQEATTAGRSRDTGPQERLTAGGDAVAVMSDSIGACMYCRSRLRSARLASLHTYSKLAVYRIIILRVGRDAGLYIATQIEDPDAAKKNDSATMSRGLSLSVGSELIPS